MQWNSLRCLHEVAQLGTMRAASEKLGMATSSISRHIFGLEQELGVALIEKGRRTIKLTEAGELAVSYFRNGSAELDHFEGQVRDLRGMRTGRVDVGISDVAVTATLSGLIADFMQANPGVGVSTRDGLTSGLIQRLVEDELHFGLLFSAPAHPKVRVNAMIPQPLMAIVRPNHPLAHYEGITFEQLAAYRVCTPPESYVIRALLSDVEQTRGVWLKSTMTSTSLLMLKEMVESSDAVTVLPKIAVEGEVRRGQLRALRIREPKLQETSLKICTRLGRQLPAAPSRLLSEFRAKLSQWEAD
jgi:DNA-binding transcriptional LysR family regulator